jgi:hypothetical protein
MAGLFILHFTLLVLYLTLEQMVLSFAIKRKYERKLLFPLHEIF